VIGRDRKTYGLLLPQCLEMLGTEVLPKLGVRL
jgi:hypothetical protein